MNKNMLHNLWRRLLLPLRFVARMCTRIWRWYIDQFKGRPWWRKTLAGLCTFIVAVLFYAFAVVTNLFWLFGRSPSVNDIVHPKTAAASEIISADGKVMGKFFNENRSPVPYDSIAPVFFQTLIATEDERFYRHHGIDFEGIVAAIKDAMGGRARGASTITQQLVKNMFRVRTQYSTGLLGRVPGLSIVIMKSKEMIIATELEMLCSKREILEMYANTVDFGAGAYGIKTAAKTYFGTTPSQLKTEEAAVLVGLLKATSAYNPKLNPQNALRRRNVVLKGLYDRRHDLAEHFDHVALTSREELTRLQAEPIRLDFSVESAYDGIALYFREAVKDEIKEKCPDVDVYVDGLKIHTTLDSRLQAYAEKAVSEQMRRVQQNFDRHWKGLGEPWRDEKGNVIPHFIEDLAKKTDAYKMLEARYPNAPDSVWHYMNRPHPVKLFSYDGPIEREMSTMDSIRYMVSFLHAGFVAMEPETGHVKAYVGDIDFASWKYDKVRAMRQPGSTFKLFVYATAMKQGLTPSDRRKDEYIRMEVYDKKHDKTDVWQPHNANGRFSNAQMPLRSAFAQSINTIAVKLGQEVGINAVIQTAHDMGIKSPLDETPSLPLGSSDVNLLELVNAYACVAADGIHVEPVLVSKIEDAQGKVIYEASPKETRALPQTAAFYMQKLLEAGVRDAGGTSQTLGAMMYLGKFGGHLDMGGKTGTSNNHSDAWFVGVTPSLVGGAWVGGEYRSIHFRTGALGQGSRTALPIVAAFMRYVMDDKTFSSKYMRRYGMPPENIDPSSFSETYYEAEEPADSLEADSLQATDDLLGPSNDESPTPNGEGHEEQAPQATTTDRKNAATDNLFE